MRSHFFVAAALIIALIVPRESRAQNGWKVDTVKVSVFGIIWGLEFTSADSGVIVGDTCLKTTNGGKTWMALAPPIAWNAQRHTFSSIHCFNNLEWVGVGVTSFRTTNAGQSWIFDSLRALNVYSSSFRAVEFVGGTGLAVGTNSAIMLSPDRGASWSSVSTPVYGPSALMYFGVASAGSAWIVGGGNTTTQNGLIIRTTTSGASWDTVLQTKTRVMTAISFADANVGYASADSIYKTTDGGATWKGVHPIGIPVSGSATLGTINGISFKHQMVGTLVGSSGRIYRTIDGGAHWTQQISNTQMDLWAVCFVDTIRGWAVGLRDIVVRTTNGGWGTLVSVQEPSSMTPKTASLLQNYPNPFNPSTTVSYDLPRAAAVSLKIFNTLGQEVALLLNERKEAGHYQTTWYASNVPSGIYFYRLQAGDIVETKKMILLK